MRKKLNLDTLCLNSFPVSLSECPDILSGCLDNSLVVYTFCQLITLLCLGVWTVD